MQPLPLTYRSAKSGLYAPMHYNSWCRHACRYTIFINIAVQGSSNKAWHIAQGPLSVVFGFGLGAIAAFCCSATRLWNNKYKRVLALVISGGCLAWMHMLHQHKAP